MLSEIVQTAARYPPSTDVVSPRHTVRPWDGTPEQLMAWSEKLNLSVNIRKILVTLSQVEMYDALDLPTVDGVVIEEEGTVVLCFRNMGVKGDDKRTLTIDVDDVEDLCGLVQRAEARVSRTWWVRTFVALGIVTFAGWMTFATRATTTTFPSPPSPPTR